MAKLVVNVVLIVTILFKDKVDSTPQLDLPLSNSTNARKIVFDEHKRLQTNGHSDLPADSAISGDKSNEVGVGDTLNYDRDRSQRFGPPYSDERDGRFYNNDNNNNQNSRYYNRNYDNGNDDDKYYAQRRPNDDYYISEKQRENRFGGYRDYYSVVRRIKAILLHF